MAWRRSTTERTYGTQTQYQGHLQEIKAFFDSCSAEGADFPWTVASFAWDTPSANRGYVVLKRKNASAGRIYIAATPTADQNTTNYLSHGLNQQVGLTIGYDRTATVDSPTQAPTAGAPFGGTLGSNWLGACYLITGLAGTSMRLRAYTDADNDGFVFQFGVTDANQSLYCVGNLIQNLHTGLPQVGQICAGGMTNGFSVRTVATDVFGFIEPFYVPLTGTASIVNRACTWDSVNGFQRLFRLTSINGDNSGALTVSAYNTLFAQANGNRYFLPIYCCGQLSNPSTSEKLFRLRRIGFGECRTRLSAQLLDNNATPRGWYLGYHQTQGSDQSGLSLLNDDFA